MRRVVDDAHVVVRDIRPLPEADQVTEPRTSINIHEFRTVEQILRCHEAKTGRRIRLPQHVADVTRTIESADGVTSPLVRLALGCVPGSFRRRDDLWIAWTCRW